MIKQEAHQTTRSICDDIGYIGGSDSENKMKDFDKETDKEDIPNFPRKLRSEKRPIKKPKGMKIRMLKRISKRPPEASNGETFRLREGKKCAVFIVCVISNLKRIPQNRNRR